jgi:membrane protease YdiL (CAAX protease family)
MFGSVIFERPGEPPPLSRAVRAALFWGLVPFLGALRNVFAAREAIQLAQDDSAKKESRFLAGIAVADVLALAAIVLGILTSASGQAKRPATERHSIGILGSTPVEGGLRIDELVEHSPALAGGLRVGDVILDVDREPIGSAERLSEGLQPPGAHLLRIRRGAGEARVQVVPEPASAIAQRVPLFRGAKTGFDGGPGKVALQFPLVLLAPLALLSLVAIALRRRIPGFLPLGAFFAAHLIAAAAAAGAFLAMSRAAGPGWGALLVAQLAMDFALLATGGWLWSRRSRLGIAAPDEADRASAALGGWTPSELPAREWGKAGALCAVLLLPRVNVVGIVLSRALHDWHLGESPLESLATMPPAGLVFVACTAVLLAPVAEEIVFRGVLYGWLRRFVAAPPAIAICAASFALFHLHYGARALGIFVIGCVLGWVRERSGTLRAPIVTHALNNAVATAFLLFGYMFR